METGFCRLKHIFSDRKTRRSRAGLREYRQTGISRAGGMFGFGLAARGVANVVTNVQRQERFAFVVFESYVSVSRVSSMSDSEDGSCSEMPRTVRVV